MHYVKYREFWQTKHFVQAGQSFLKNRYYCPFPVDTNAYDEYWDEHEFYIRNGIEYEGEVINGLSHLYLNFCPIWNKKKKQYVFPDFRSVDVEWFEEIERAMGLGPYGKDEFRPSLHITGKTRQSGHSLKGCVPLVFNTHFVPGTKNYIGSYDGYHALKTFDMFSTYQKHLYEHTAFGKGYLKVDAGKYYKFGYHKEVNNIFIESGYQSEIFIVTFNQKTTKGVGGGCDLFIVEESGAFPKFIEAVQYVQNAVKDGDYTTGTILAYGAAGNLTDAMQYEKACMNPKAYDAWAYWNKWNPQSPNKTTAYFVPNYSCRPPHIEENGTPRYEQAIQAREDKYQTLMTTDYGSYLQKISQEPNTLEEMFDVRTNLRFSKDLIDAQIKMLEDNPALLGTPVEVYMDFLKGKVAWKFSDKQPIREYPVPELQDYSGCVEMFEFPEDIPEGEVVISIDSYNQESSTTKSYANICVWQKASSIKYSYGRRVLAEYFGRPERKEIVYEILLHLSLLYKNAPIMVENEDIELVPWFYNKSYDHLLMDQPDIIRALIPNSKTFGKRAKGIHAADPLIIAADNKQDKYMREKIGVRRNDAGEDIGPIYGIERERSLGYLKEARRYFKTDQMNFDRIRTRGWALLAEEETYMTDQAAKPDDSEWATFLANTSGDETNDGIYWERTA